MTKRKKGKQKQTRIKQEILPKIGQFKSKMRLKKGNYV